MNLKTFSVKDKTDGYWAVSIVTVEDGIERRTDTKMMALNHTGDFNDNVISAISKELADSNNHYSEAWLKTEISNYLKIST